MSKLRCDICGGQIEMQPDKRGVCLNCGTSYSLDTMREMFTGVKVSVTGSNEDVEQWRQLLDKYYSSGDFTEAERTVKKILEAIPNDAQASEKYEQLQVLKYMEIKNGILTSYSGAAKVLVVPEIVKDIAPGVFKENQYLEEVVLPNGLETIKKDMFSGCSKLKKVYIPPTVTAIESGAFYSCTSLTEIDIPASVVNIGYNDGFAFGVFEECVSLAKIILHPGLKRLGKKIFCKTALEEVILPEGLEVIGEGAFMHCTSLKRLVIPDSVIDLYENEMWKSYFSPLWFGCSNLENIEYPKRFNPIVFRGTAYYDKFVAPRLRSKGWRKAGRCQHCGGEFGLFSGKCKKCGRSKDY